MAAATIITNVVTGGSNNHATVASEANSYATDFVTQGVLGTIGNSGGAGPGTGSFGVKQDTVPDMGITIIGTGNTTSTNSVAYVTVTPSSQDKQVLRARMSSDYTAYTINANATGSTVYDWIYLQASAANANTPSATADNVITLLTSRSTSNNTDNGSPPTYGILLAVVTVANGASSITNANISDRRTQVVFNTGGTSSTNGWTSLGYTPNTVTYNGNRSYSLVYNSVDLTGILSNGMRIKHTRTATAPTQCTSLNGTTQYWVKTTPNKLTFTDDFTVSAWVKLNTYQAGSIVSRYNGTSGWDFSVTSAGQVQLYGFNAGSANNSGVLSYQSLPLNKWVHVTAELDMSSFTVSATTSYIMFDGIDIPAQVTRGGTNPTALVQAGNLEVGSRNTGTQLFSGKIAQVAVFNAKVTEATIRGYISQTIAGTETSLASAYSFNNAVTDLNTTTPNDLSVGGGSAVATNSDSPFSLDDTGTPLGTTDVAIITSKTFSTNTTLTVQVPEGNAIPTTGGVSAVSYSNVKTPYGFPAHTSKWTIEAIYRVTTVKTTLTGAVVYYQNTAITLPIGTWGELGFQGPVQSTRAAGSTGPGNAVLSNSSSAIDTVYTPLMQPQHYHSSNVASIDQITYFNASTKYAPDTAAQTAVYLLLFSSTADSTFGFRGDVGQLTIWAVLGLI